MSRRPLQPPRHEPMILRSLIVISTGGASVQRLLEAARADEHRRAAVARRPDARLDRDASTPTASNA